MSVMPEYGARLMHDMLFSAITVAAVYAFACWQDRGVRHWLAVGALIGLAFITKGSGHLLWAGLVGVSFYKHRWALARRPIVYAAACGFVLVASFYLMRNVKAYGSPFYSYIAPQIWLEKWRDFWALQLTPAYKNATFFWYMETHSVGQLLFKLGRGVVLFIGLLAYTSGIVFQNQVARVFPGIGLLVLAGMGLRRRWREGRRVEVVAVGGTLAVYFAALSLAASGMNELQVRYVVPYIAILIPYAVHETLERLWPWLRAWIATRWPRFHPTQGRRHAAGAVLRRALRAGGADRVREEPARPVRGSTALARDVAVAVAEPASGRALRDALPELLLELGRAAAGHRHALAVLVRKPRRGDAEVHAPGARPQGHDRPGELGLRGGPAEAVGRGRRARLAGVPRLAALLRGQRDAQPVSGVLPAGSLTQRPSSRALQTERDASFLTSWRSSGPRPNASKAAA